MEPITKEIANDIMFAKLSEGTNIITDVNVFFAYFPWVLGSTKSKSAAAREFSKEAHHASNAITNHCTPAVMNPRKEIDLWSDEPLYFFSDNTLEYYSIKKPQAEPSRLHQWQIDSLCQEALSVIYTNEKLYGIKSYKTAVQDFSNQWFLNPSDQPGGWKTFSIRDTTPNLPRLKVNVDPMRSLGNPWLPRLKSVKSYTTTPGSNHKYLHVFEPGCLLRYEMSGRAELQNQDRTPLNTVSYPIILGLGK